MTHPSKPQSQAAFGLGLALVLLLAPALRAQAQPAAVPAADTTAAPAKPKPASTADASTSATAPVSVATETVTGQADVQVPITPAVAAEVLQTIPGGTGLIDATQIEQGTAQTNADALAYQPGVYAQPVAGSDRLDIHIRGSAINRAGGTGSYYSGLDLLFDGLPVSSPGGTPYELFEPLGLSYTEVLKGVNGNDLGSISLGGAINFVSKTGYDASPWEVRLETGSFGYYKGQFSSGQVLGPWDYYISETNSHEQGFQAYSRSNNSGTEFNLGRKINDKVETRLYIRNRYTSNETGAGSLTQAQVEEGPTLIAPAATPAAEAAKAWSRRVQPGSTWVADKTTIHFDPDQTLTAGIVYHNFPIVQESASFPPYAYAPEISIYPNGFEQKTRWFMVDLSEVLRYEDKKDLFGLPSDASLQLTSVRALHEGDRIYDVNPATQVETLVVEPATNNSSDNTLAFVENLEVFKNVWLTAGVTEAFIRRTLNVLYPVTTQTAAPWENNSYYTLPRFGLRYDVTPDFSVYGNISRSVEPLNDWAEYSGPPYFTPTVSGTLLGTTSALGPRPLQAQTAVSEEVGVKGKWGIFDGSLGVYREYVDNELLTVIIDQANTPPYFFASNLTAQSNASPTTKQGVEFGLDTQLWSDHGHELLFRQAFTYSNFFYDNDPTFGHNQEPGLPRDFYQGELRYDDPTGFYIGGTVQYASKEPADYANTFYTNAYRTYGTTFGFAPPKKHWEVFVSLQNLDNEHYVANVSPSFNLAHADSAIFNPGAPFSWNVGFQIGY